MPSRRGATSTRSRSAAAANRHDWSAEIDDTSDYRSPSRQGEGEWNNYSRPSPYSRRDNDRSYQHQRPSASDHQPRAGHSRDRSPPQRPATQGGRDRSQRGASQRGRSGTRGSAASRGRGRDHGQGQPSAGTGEADMSHVERSAELRPEDWPQSEDLDKRLQDLWSISIAAPAIWSPRRRIGCHQRRSKTPPPGTQEAVAVEP